jgi:hypothetical protein
MLPRFFAALREAGDRQLAGVAECGVFEPALNDLIAAAKTRGHPDDGAILVLAAL